MPPVIDKPAEYVQVGLVTTGELRQLRGAIEALVQKVDLGARVEAAQADLPGFASGTAGRVLADGVEIGGLGMIDAKALHYYGLEQALAGGWVSFDALLAKAGRVATYQPVPRFPSVKRDLSLIVDEPVTWKQLEAALAAVPQAMRAGAQYVTTYRGKPIAPGRKSVTLTLVYRAAEGTLRSEQVDAEVAQVLEAMKKAFAAELRT